MLVKDYHNSLNESKIENQLRNYVHNDQFLSSSVNQEKLRKRSTYKKAMSYEIDRITTSKYDKDPDGVTSGRRK